ncbi:hypothetical protein T459_28938 [Capsicum annuum]|uniref:KIB1-4 beta-propeller domain-containing protein n=1 Tax=Capsicum annuum TaxID=4072 RepID=A0A2G2YIN2_CAPAN|nr:hypothetical protein T459_28938 [Capsicum annuum]
MTPSRFQTHASLYSATKGKTVFDVTLTYGDVVGLHMVGQLFKIGMIFAFSRQTICLPCPKYNFGKIMITKNPTTNPNNFEVAAMVGNQYGDFYTNLAILKQGSHTWFLTHHDQYELLKVQISNLTSPHVKIFKLVATQSNTQESTFEELDDLGDEALFLSEQCSMSVLASKFPGCKANSIYYLDCKFDMMNIVRLQYDGLQYSHSSVKASSVDNMPALWIIPTFNVIFVEFE